MKIAPFRIEKIVLDTARDQVKRKPVDCLVEGSPNFSRHVVDADVSGYVVTSSAPYNTDDKVTPEAAAENSVDLADRGILAIAQDLHRIKTNPTICEPPQLVIAVHGYNTSEAGIGKWYHDIFRYAAQNDKHIRKQKNLVFVGYRWSSEQIRPDKLWDNLKALPDVPRNLLIAGLFLLGFCFGDIVVEVARSLEIISYPPITVTLLNALFSRFTRGDISLAVKLLEAFLIIGAELLFGLVLMVPLAVAVLLLLRLTVYFRDVYRAINFAVPDLTEFIRQLEKTLLDLEDSSNSLAYAVPVDALQQEKQSGSLPRERVNLSFIGHSMGGLVITNVVRILSDVFDRYSIAQRPSSKIGETLRLGRLILASPDIPLLSIVSSRANGLASSLRRFDEAYLFSSEGDLALKLASTAANYISFPSAHHHHGHRLGSLALRDDAHGKGIINLDSFDNYTLDKTLGEAVREDKYDILKCLVTACGPSKEGVHYQSLKKLFADEHRTQPDATLADLFTFFDCTHYKDYALKAMRTSGMNERSKDEVGLLTRANAESTYLTPRDYVCLFADMARGKRDVHGGYFRGVYSRELIYQMAFLGFRGMLSATEAERSEVNSAKEALQALHSRCEAKGLQVYLSPLRYRVDVQGADLPEAKAQMLQTVKEAEEQAEEQPNKPASAPVVSSKKPDAIPLESVSSAG